MNMETHKNPLLEVQKLGQSLWLDYIRRGMLVSGELQQLIERDGLRGVTSNPSIFHKAISGSDDYTSAINSLADTGKSAVEIYETLAFADIRDTADLFRPLYDESGGKHGFVSLEVSPHLARNVEGTIQQARNYWSSVDKPNVLIKVPATKEGLSAIRRLISEGINVNVTLLFGLDRYREVAEAYIAGLEDRARRGEPVEGISSVASFFLSRIDVLVDSMLEKLAASGGEKTELSASLEGAVAIASAKIAYQIYKEIFASERFNTLAQKGARTQRVLWASTSTKNPAYSDVKYVEALIGPETVNTLPMKTLDAYRDHGKPAARLEDHLDEAREVLHRLEELKIDIKQVTQQLVEEGIEKFNDPYDKLMDELNERLNQARGRRVAPRA
jgi:transaldolase/glucose-6-phosphate isomerase